MIYLMMGVMTFAFVFFKAFQQKNVIHNNWKLIPIGSYGLAVLETAVPALAITEIMEHGWLTLIYIAFANGTGGVVGCWVAMHLHNRLRNKDE